MLNELMEKFYNRETIMIEGQEFRINELSCEYEPLSYIVTIKATTVLKTDLAKKCEMKMINLKC